MTATEQMEGTATESTERTVTERTEQTGSHRETKQRRLNATGICFLVKQTICPTFKPRFSAALYEFVRSVTSVPVPSVIAVPVPSVSSDG